VLWLHLVDIYSYPRVSIATTIGRGLTQAIMGAWRWHLRLARDSADFVWLRAHCHLLHAPPRPHTYRFTHTTPVYTTTLRHTLTPSTLHISELDKIVFPRYSSQSFTDTREGVYVTRVRIPNPGALPIIASVSPQPFPCLFACLYDSVSYVYTFFSTCLSACVARAACFVFGFYRYVYYSDSSVCVSQQT